MSDEPRISYVPLEEMTLLPGTPAIRDGFLRPSDAPGFGQRLTARRTANGDAKHGQGETDGDGGPYEQEFESDIERGRTGGGV